MRIAFLIRMLVMDAMRSDPENRSAFEGQRGTCGQDVLDPFRSLVSAMSKQPVVAHADAQASGNPPQEHRNQESFPGEKEERRDGAHVKQAHKIAVTQLTSSSAAAFRSKTSRSM